MRNVRMNVVFSSLQKLLPGIKFDCCPLHGFSYFVAVTYLPLLLNESGLHKSWLSALYCSLAADGNTQGIPSPLPSHSADQ